MNVGTWVAVVVSIALVAGCASETEEVEDQGAAATTSASSDPAPERFVAECREQLGGYLWTLSRSDDTGSCRLEKSKAGRTLETRSMICPKRDPASCRSIIGLATANVRD